MDYVKNYGGYLVAGFAGWEFAHSDWTVGILAAVCAAGLAYWSNEN